MNTYLDFVRRLLSLMAGAGLLLAEDGCQSLDAPTAQSARISANESPRIFGPHDAAYPHQMVFKNGHWMKMYEARLFKVPGGTANPDGKRWFVKIVRNPPMPGAAPAPTPPQVYVRIGANDDQADKLARRTYPFIISQLPENFVQSVTPDPTPVNVPDL